MGRDDRGVFRITVDVLATAEQVSALQGVIGAAICAAPEDHDGPCRIAWSIGRYDGADADEEGADLTPDDVAFIREHLAPVEVWPADAVDRSLGISNGGRLQTQVPTERADTRHDGDADPA